MCTLGFENVVCRTSSVKRQFETSTQEVLKIKQTRENQSNVQCPGMGSESTLSKSLPLPKTMRLKQAFAILNMSVVGGVNDKLIIAIIMR